MFKVMAIITIVCNLRVRCLPSEKSRLLKFTPVVTFAAYNAAWMMLIWIFITGSFNFIDQWDRQKLPIAVNVANRCHFVGEGRGLISGQKYL